MKNKTISEIKNLFEQERLTEENIVRLKADERKGVQSLLKKYERQKQKEQLLKEQFIKMHTFENQYYSNGCKLIAGVDEAGRGPLAGPVVAAAVVLPRDNKLIGLTDSKLLKEEQRLYFYDKIKKEAVAYHVAIVNNKTIDEVNIFEATKLAMKDAINQLNPQPDFVLVDAIQLTGLPCSTQPIVKGDQKSISIAAASVLAKVTRDQLMKEIHNEFPAFNFESNMGYGTKHHLNQLQKNGITPYHRQSFAPVRAAMK